MTSRPRQEPLSRAGDDTGSIVRLYTVTDGRTRPRHHLNLQTVLGPGRRRPGPGLSAESAQIVALCRQRPCPLAELAGTTGLHVTAVKVLVSDLIDAGALKVPVPEAPGDRSEIQLLESLSAHLKIKYPDAVAKAG
ncbi:DUF742 domain-containing protein [Streptomyces sp. NBC_00075]|uniref:DUF742 domain-containing protein n=1 Tax=Streptomyces sp. NBC_00093 TaxID=2975649 RepID=A0AAU2A808_9ACTN